MKNLFAVLIILLAFTSLSFSNELDSALKSKKPVVLKLGADTCPPCRAMKPIMAELKKEQSGKVVFLDLDIYKNEDLARQYRIMLIPTVIFFDKNGKEKAKYQGFMSKSDIMKTLKDLKLING